MSLRLPYLQVTAETWTKAKMLAAILDIPMGVAFMMICDLWSWGLSLGPKDEAPTGEFTGSYAIAVLAGAVGWTGDRETLKAALVELDLIVLTGEGLRVKGTDRYKATWEKNKRRKPGETVPVPPGSAAKPERKTYTQTQTEKPLPSEEVKNAPPPKELVPLIASRPTKPPETWTGDDFWQWAQWTRQQNGLLVERKRPHPSKLGSWFSSALMTPGVTIEALKAGFGRFGQDKHWEGSDPPFPVAAFMAGWDNYTRPGDRHAHAS